jgi:hypothetical protein
MWMRTVAACVILLAGCAAVRNEPAPELTPAQECRRKCEDTYFSCTSGCGAAQECILTYCGAPRTACLQKCPLLQP